MKHKPRLVGFLPCLKFMLCGIVLSCLPVRPQDSLAQGAEVDPPRLLFARKFDDARLALERRNYAEAVDLLEAGLLEAESIRDTNWQASFHFQLALTLQQQVLAQAPNQSDATAFRGAVSHYERLLALQPTSGASRNNLAKIYSRTGRAADARRLYEEAIALNDDRKALYAMNLADLLQEAGNLPEAARYYRLAVDESPDNRQAHERLVAAYQASDPRGLVRYLWVLLDRGREIRGLETALQVLYETAPGRRGAGELTEADRIEILSCAVACLSRTQRGPLRMSASDDDEANDRGTNVYRMFRRLASDDAVGPGVREILQLEQVPDVGAPTGYDWWARHGSGRRDPTWGVWPRDSFRELIRSRAAWHVLRDDLDTAEAYYLLSARLTEAYDREPDLQALIQVVDIYVRRGQVGEIQDLIERYAGELFYGKGQAYRDSDWKEIYAFHRTLGILYATTENWGDSGTVASAVFQLENALEKREIYNRRIAAEKDLPPIPVEPRLVNLLAEAYARDSHSRATRLRLQYAETLLEEGDPTGAGTLLDAVEEASLTPREQEQYNRLRRSLARLMRERGPGG